MHALVSLHPSANVAGLVRAFKSATSFDIDRHDARDAVLRWQRGYAALSVSARDTPALVEYIVRQRERHGARTTHAEWEPAHEEEDCLDDA